MYLHLSDSKEKTFIHGLRVLFLDVDGVLNSAQYLHNKPRKTWPFEHIDPAAVQLLNKIVRQTDCKIVISSSWRVILPWWVLRMVLACRGFEFTNRIIDQTPRHGFDNRGMEIQAWLEKHPDVSQFVIIDDDADMAHLMPKLVQTSWQHGIDGIHAVEVISRLTSPQVADKVES